MATVARVFMLACPAWYRNWRPISGCCCTTWSWCYVGSALTSLWLAWRRPTWPCAWRRPCCGKRDVPRCCRTPATVTWCVTLADCRWPYSTSSTPITPLCSATISSIRPRLATFIPRFVSPMRLWTTNAASFVIFSGVATWGTLGHVPPKVLRLFSPCTIITFTSRYSYSPQLPLFWPLFLDLFNWICWSLG